MVGASFPNNSIASVLSFVPFTARQAEYQRLGWAFSHRLSLFDKSHRIGGLLYVDTTSMNPSPTTPNL
jgi:hypothetical protein